MPFMILVRCKNKWFEAQGLRCVTAFPSAARTDSDSWVDGGSQRKGSGKMAAVARRRQPRAKQKGSLSRVAVGGCPDAHSIAVVGTSKWC